MPFINKFKVELIIENVEIHLRPFAEVSFALEENILSED